MISSETLNNLETQLKDQISYLFPAVKIVKLDVDSFPDQNVISINLSYRVLNQSLDDIQINFTSDGL